MDSVDENKNTRL
jgi:hypothetical protein